MKGTNKFEDPKTQVLKIIEKIEDSKIDPVAGWSEIKKLKEQYLFSLKNYYPKIKSAEQSWHSFIGNKFEKIVLSIIRAYINKIKLTDESLKGLSVLTAAEVEKNEVIYRKLAVPYGKYLLLPDVDLTIVNFDLKDPWRSTVISIISCKTSLRERIAQACYWKLKLLSSDVTKNIKVFLTTVDHDNDFDIDITKKDRIEGKTRNRIISEFELDRVYIFRENFSYEWTNDKIRRGEDIFNDLLSIIKQGNL